MENYGLVIIGSCLLAISLTCCLVSCETYENSKNHCYYCEHVDLEENGGFCLDGKHYVLEDGVLKEIGECFAK